MQAGVVVCPQCGSRNVRRSRRSGAVEVLKSSLGRYPYRCKECRGRFFAEGVAEQESALEDAEGGGRLFSTRLDLVLYALAIAVLMVLLHLLIRWDGSSVCQGV